MKNMSSEFRYEYINGILTVYVGKKLIYNDAVEEEAMVEDTLLELQESSKIPCFSCGSKYKGQQFLVVS